MKRSKSWTVQNSRNFLIFHISAFANWHFKERSSRFRMIDHQSPSMKMDLSERLALLCSIIISNSLLYIKIRICVYNMLWSYVLYYESVNNSPHSQSCHLEYKRVGVWTNLIVHLWCCFLSFFSLQAPKIIHLHYMKKSIWPNNIHIDIYLKIHLLCQWKKWVH